jgi:elongation factor G
MWAPQVVTETIRKLVKVEGRFVRQSGGKGQYGHVVITAGTGRSMRFEFVPRSLVVRFREYVTLPAGMKELLRIRVE